MQRRTCCALPVCRVTTEEQERRVAEARENAETASEQVARLTGRGQ